MEPNKVQVKTFVGDRGFLFQIFDTDGEGKLTFDGVDFLKIPPIKRTYIVGNFSKDIVRGMHYHKFEWKYFFVMKGSVKFVISPTAKITDKTKTFVLSDKKPEMLIIPPKNYNGWTALEDDTVMIGLSNFSLEETLKDDARILPDKFMELFEVKNR